MVSYYGSDLNRFIDEYCTRKMTAINIDLFMIKVSDKSIRFIESKHMNEGEMSRGQDTALRLLTKMLHESYEVNVYIVRGDYPYDTAEITDFRTDKTYTLEGEQLIKWLNFEVGLAD